MKKETQHKLGQHYSKESFLVKKYNEILLKQEKMNMVIVDPFCGEGHLIIHFLDLFDLDKQIDLINNKKIMALDIDEKNIISLKEKFKIKYGTNDDLLNEIFIHNDSLLNTKIPKNSFIFTNPPYLAKNVCKKKFNDDFDKYFKSIYQNYNDYYEISLDLYSKFDGIWIVPSNILSSDIMGKLRKKILYKMSNIVIYKKKTFEDTDISVCTFLIDNKINETKKDILFVADDETLLNFEISKNSNLVKEWDKIKDFKNTLNIKQGFLDSAIEIGSNKCVLLNTNYKEEEYNISDKQYNLLKENVLILRTTDTGGKDGKIGLYTINEIWKSEKSIGLVTKISSRVYTQLFFNNLTIEEQLKLKNSFNKKLNELRKKYDSIFLTNYKNVSNKEQRKRISFKEVFSLISYLSKK